MRVRITAASALEVLVYWLYKFTTYLLTYKVHLYRADELSKY